MLKVCLPTYVFGNMRSHNALHPSFEELLLPRPLEKVYKLFLEIKLYSPAFYVRKKSKLHV